MRAKMVEELCKKLKKKRINLGYSLEDVVEKTKIHPSVIKDIEACRLDDLSPVYSKGFIKIYAYFLGVDVGDTFKDSSKVLESSLQTIPIKKTSFKDKTNLQTMITPEVKRNIIFTAGIIIGFIIIFILFSSIFHLIKRNISMRPTGVAKSNLVEKLPSALPRPKQRGKKGRKIIVSLRVKRDCFIRVRRDGEVVFEGILRKGALEQWQAAKELELKINDASSVELSVNGRILPPLSKIHQPIKSLKITARGISIKK